ncbi:MAG TPA: hypothetical protein VNR62_11315 [Cellulomonas sp.]|nr:hypothetical protein [Cellulomonas sp.]
MTGYVAIVLGLCLMGGTTLAERVLEVDRLEHWWLVRTASVVLGAATLVVGLDVVWPDTPDDRALPRAAVVLVGLADMAGAVVWLWVCRETDARSAERKERRGLPSRYRLPWAVRWVPAVGLVVMGLLVVVA